MLRVKFRENMLFLPTCSGLRLCFVSKDVDKWYMYVACALQKGLKNENNPKKHWLPVPGPCRRLLQAPCRDVSKTIAQLQHSSVYTADIFTVLQPICNCKLSDVFASTVGCELSTTQRH